MPSALAGKHVLVTGAGSGIGRAIASEAARRGGRVSVVDIDRGRAEAVVSAIVKGGGRAEAFAADVSRLEDVEALAAKAGAVDVLVNNAGVAVVAPFDETKLADWEWVFGVNVWGPIKVTRAFLPAMLLRRSGHVVVVASLAGLIGAPGMVAYTTTKFAAVGFAEALRLEVEGRGVDVTVVCPGFVRTDFHRATRYQNDRFRRFLDAPPSFYGLEPDDVARAALDGVEQRKKLVVLGIEKVGWWLKRLAPSAAHAITSIVGRRTVIAPPAERCTPS